MNFILDIIFVIVFIICVFAGYKKGFVKSLTELVSYFISVIAARIISYSLAPKIYALQFEPSIRETVSEKFAQVGEDITVKVQSAIDSIPNISGFLSVIGIDKEQAALTVSNEVQSGGANIVDALMDNIVSPVAVFVLRMIIFLIAFAVCLFVMKLISKVLDKLAKLPVLKQTNKAFGLIFGALKGITVVFVACAAIQLIAGLIGSESIGQIVSASKIISVFNTLIGAFKA